MWKFENETTKFDGAASTLGTLGTLVILGTSTI
jgi:hypothetical protein